MTGELSSSPDAKPEVLLATTNDDIFFHFQIVVAVTVLTKRTEDESLLCMKRSTKSGEILLLQYSSRVDSIVGVQFLKIIFITHGRDAEK